MIQIQVFRFRFIYWILDNWISIAQNERKGVLLVLWLWYPLKHDAGALYETEDSFYQINLEDHNLQCCTENTHLEQCLS